MISQAALKWPDPRDIRSVLGSARSSAYRAVNTAMVHAYWQVGRLIVKHEQGGKDRTRNGAAFARSAGAEADRRVRPGVIRRMDAVLEPTKQTVLYTKRMLDDAEGLPDGLLNGGTHS